MDNLYPLAKLGSLILMINKSDKDFIGGERALEVMSVQIDLDKKTIFEIMPLEKHLKFNPWEEIVEEAERELVFKVINNKFSDNDIKEKIVDILEKTKIV